MTVIIVVLLSIAGTVVLGATALTAADVLASTPPDAAESMADLLAWEMARPPAVRAQDDRGSQCPPDPIRGTIPMIPHPREVFP